MISLRMVAIAALVLLTLPACGKDETEISVAASGNALLSYVPRNTPYLAANLERTPDQVVDSFLQKAAPVLSAAQSELAELRTALESEPEATDQSASLMLALLQELDGKLDRAGLEGLGLDLQADKVFYGMGAFPVIRLGLSDATVLRSSVQRILDRAAIQVSEKHFQGQAYWQLSTAADEPHAVDTLGVYAAIVDEHFAISVFPGSAESAVLPLFLGLNKPDDSDAEARLLSANHLYGFTPYFSSILDLQLLADELLQASSSSGRSEPDRPGDANSRALVEWSDECKSELREIIDHAPRLVAGTTELTPDAIGLQYVVETESELAKQLVGLVAQLPKVNAISTRLLELSFGIKVGPARDFLREKVMLIAQTPYQCEHLYALNEVALSVLSRLEQPLPPLFNNFSGLRLSLGRLTMAGSMPEVIEGLLAIHVQQPEMFVGMAQLFLPGLANLELARDKPPVQIPTEWIPIPDFSAFAAVSDDAIGLSFGAGEENGLTAYLKQKSSVDGTFLSLNYDAGAYLDFTQGLSERWQTKSTAAADENAGADTDHHPARSAQEFAEAIQQAYKAVADRSRLSLRITERGLVIDNHMTFH